MRQELISGLASKAFFPLLEGTMYIIRCGARVAESGLFGVSVTTSGYETEKVRLVETKSCEQWMKILYKHECYTILDAEILHDYNVGASIE